MPPCADRLMLRLSQVFLEGILYLSGTLYVVFSPANEGPEDLRLEWCEEYHPKLT